MHTLIKGVSFSPQPMWDFTIHLPSGPNVLVGTRSLLQSMWDPTKFTLLRGQHPWHIASCHLLWGSASSLAHRLVFDSDSICNGPSPPLADIVLFGLFPFGFPLKVIKTCLLGRDFHTLIKGVSFSSLINVGSHNPPPFGAQRSRWHSFPSPIDVGPPPSRCPSGPSILGGASPGVWL